MAGLGRREASPEAPSARSCLRAGVNVPLRFIEPMLGSGGAIVRGDDIRERNRGPSIRLFSQLVSGAAPLPVALGSRTRIDA